MFEAAAQVPGFADEALVATLAVLRAAHDGPLGGATAPDRVRPLSGPGGPVPRCEPGEGRIVRGRS